MPFDLDAIRAANHAANARWTAGETSMTRLPDDRSRRGRLGYVPGPGEPSLQEREARSQANYRAYLAQGAAASRTAPAFDWRNVNGHNYISSVSQKVLTLIPPETSSALSLQTGRWT